MIALMYDTLLIKLYRFIYGLVFSETNIEESTKRNIVTFTVIAIIYGVGQYFVLRYLNCKNKEIKITQRLHINLIHNAIVILQFILVALLGFIILQMVITTSYSVAILFAAVGISYTLAIVMMGILADRFFSWFRTNRSIVVLVYGLATASTFCKRRIYSCLCRRLAHKPTSIHRTSYTSYFFNPFYQFHT